MSNDQKGGGSVIVMRVPYSQWQPIDSAPRDGTPVDIWSPKYGRLTNYRRVSMSRTNVFYDPAECGVCCIRDATHWMPLPSPPGQAPNE